MLENDVAELIKVFKGYRDLITPIEQNLRDFSVSFENMQEDIKNLSGVFDGNVNTKLDKIYKDLSSQAEKSKSLLSQIDKFTSTTKNYIGSIEKLTSTIDNINNKLGEVEKIQKTADEQVERINGIIEEKKKNYDIKQLQKSLDNYNSGVEKINNYINKDVAENLKNNSDKVQKIQDTTDNIFESLVQEKASIEKLIENYSQSNKLLQTIVEKEAVNSEYIYSVLDKWAEDRNVKIKKK